MRPPAAVSAGFPAGRPRKSLKPGEGVRGRVARGNAFAEAAPRLGGHAAVPLSRPGIRGNSMHPEHARDSLGVPVSGLPHVGGRRLG